MLFNVIAPIIRTEVWTKGIDSKETEIILYRFTIISRIQLNKTLCRNRVQKLH